MRSVFAVVVFCIIAVSGYSEETPAGDALLTFVLQPAPESAFVFGKREKVSVVIKNISKHALVVLRIAPNTTGNEEINLANVVYGSVQKDETCDEYEHDSTSQQATRLPFYGGFLLPGEQVVVGALYRPVARKDCFSVSYAASEQPYEGTLKSLAPLRVYVPKKDNELSNGRTRYMPFLESRWKEIIAANGTGQELEQCSSQRNVLMPDIRSSIKKCAHRQAFVFPAKEVLQDEALNVAAHVADQPVEALTVAYSSSLKAYCVFEKQCTWILASRDQRVKGDVLALFPPALLNVLDDDKLVKVRIGAKQEGLGPQVHSAKYLFWDRFGVFYGDGMYTRGEFLHLTKDDILPFLQMAYKKDMILNKVNYYVRSAYFQLQERLETSKE